MGFYIEGPAKGKVSFITVEHGGMVISEPKSFKDVPEDLGLICVVDNGPFEAAGYAFNEREFDCFRVPDGRPRTWMTMEKKSVEKLTGYVNYGKVG